MVCWGLIVKIPEPFENWLLQGHSEDQLRIHKGPGNST